MFFQCSNELLVMVKLDILGNFSLGEILEVPALVSGAINDGLSHNTYIHGYLVYTKSR